MHQQIFVNLAVNDLPKSRAFFERLGLTFNPQFSNEQGACLVLGENIFAMLLVKAFFKGFTGKPIADATQTTEAIICLSCQSRAEVDAIVAKAVAAGGTAPRAPQDHGFMYGHGFEDLDGHIWELAYMDMSAAPAQM
jgi:predicted lactoylglutathione lyase